MAKALDAMGSHWRREGIEREWKGCCPEREKELFTLIIMAPRVGKDAGVRGGPDDAVGEILSHGD